MCSLGMLRSCEVASDTTSHVASDSDREQLRPTGPVEGHLLHRAIEAKTCVDREELMPEFNQFYEDLRNPSGSRIGELWS